MVKIAAARVDRDNNFISIIHAGIILVEKGVGHKIRVTVTVEVAKVAILHKSVVLLEVKLQKKLPTQIAEVSTNEGNIEASVVIHINDLAQIIIITVIVIFVIENWRRRWEPATVAANTILAVKMHRPGAEKILYIGAGHNDNHVGLAVPIDI